MTLDSGALTWQVRQRFRAWHVAQLAATVRTPCDVVTVAARPWPPVRKPGALCPIGLGKLAMSAVVNPGASVSLT
jgi:hypothetical protein